MRIDPLLAATGMKHVEDEQQHGADGMPHATAGHGDPLLKEVEHTHKLALHQTFEGQGDDLMDATIAKMTDDAKDAIMGSGGDVDHKRLGVGEKHVGAAEWNTKGEEKIPDPHGKPQ